MLDLGCGYGEFINQVSAPIRYAMDLNPDAARRLDRTGPPPGPGLSSPWALPDQVLDLVFTSNFFEHLPDKAALARTLAETRRSLKPGGRLVALGPNIKFLPGQYWDFWDHYLPLTELSLAEGLAAAGKLSLERAVARFLPYTMSAGPRYPLALLRLLPPAAGAVESFWPPVSGRRRESQMNSQTAPGTTLATLDVVIPARDKRAASPPPSSTSAWNSANRVPHENRRR